VKTVAILLISYAILTALPASRAFADRMTEFEKEVRREERYHRAQEKAAIQEEENEQQERALQKRKQERRRKNLRAQEKRPVYEYEVEGDELGGDLGDLE